MKGLTHMGGALNQQGYQFSEAGVIEPQTVGAWCRSYQGKSIGPVKYIEVVKIVTTKVGFGEVIGAYSGFMLI